VRIVYFGTPAFAVPPLRALLDAGHDVVLVVTQPDRPAGRGRRSQEPAVKTFARERGLEVGQPEKVRDPAFVERIRALAPDAFAVAAYGKILPKALLDVPPLGAVNVHGSLLPRHRGAAPIQRAILAGDPTTGVTIMLMNERMDAGDVLAMREMPIEPEDTAETLSQRMSEIGAAALVETLDAWRRGAIRPVAQREDEATFAPLVTKDEGEIDWTRSAVAIERAVRAFSPWPGAYTWAGGKILKIHRATTRSDAEAAAPGMIRSASGAELAVATGDGILVALEVQLEGRKRLSVREFLSGGGLRGVSRLGRS
jgi:methionyl-tRNA formyltransferase